MNFDDVYEDLDYDYINNYVVKIDRSLWRRNIKSTNKDIRSTNLVKTENSVKMAKGLNKIGFININKL